MGKAMGDGYDLTGPLRDARTISAAWGRRLPWYKDEFVSACNLAIAQALRLPDLDDFDGMARCIMQRRCRDVYRERICNRGRIRPLLLKWAEEWVDTDKWGGDATSAGRRYLDFASDTWEPDDSAWRFRQVAPYIATLPGLKLATPRATMGVLLYLELGSMEAVAERMGVSESRVSQYLAEVARGIKSLKVAV